MIGSVLKQHAQPAIGELELLYIKTDFCMFRSYTFYYRLFTFKFLIRILFVKLLRIYDTEVRQLNVADRLLDSDVKLQSLNDGRVKLAIDINNCPFDVILRKGTSDLLVFNQVIVQRSYGPLHDLVRGYLAVQEIKVIIDVGANIGLTSLFFNSIFPDAAIYAIEPAPRNFLILKENAQANRLSIYPFQNALLVSRGRVKVDNAFRDRQDWSTQVIASDAVSDIEGISLADFVKDNDLHQIDILKVDIEGYEAELFKSPEFLSELRRVKFLALEVHEEKADRITIVNQLQDLGFRLMYKGETIFGFNESAL